MALDLSALPDDFFVTSSQFTRTTYRDWYPSVDPSSPALSQAGKVVIVTAKVLGGMFAFAKSFARAKCAGLVLVARKAADLEDAAAEMRAINPNVKVMTRPLDIRSQEGVQALYRDIKSEFGTADVLVNNAGCGTSVLPIRDMDSKDFWYDFEVNVKGTFLMTQEFLKLVGSENQATIINIASGTAIATIPHTSSYALSKLIQVQIQRFVGIENPNIVAVSIEPGTVMTAITKPAFVKFNLDTFELAGGVAVWLITEKAKFMNGRFMAAQWSVDELMEREKEIVDGGLLLEGLQGKFGKAQFQ